MRRTGQLPRLLGLGAMLACMPACRPLCRVEIPRPEAAWVDWFGPDPGLSRTGFLPDKWRRTGDYTGGTVWVEPVDGGVMASCEPCSPFQARIAGTFGRTLEDTLKERSTRLRLAPGRDGADSLMAVKVVAVKEERLFFKLPIGWGGGAHDHFEFWLKVTEARTGKIVFRYRTRWAGAESEEDLRLAARVIVADLETFKKDHN